MRKVFFIVLILLLNIYGTQAAELRDTSIINEDDILKYVNEQLELGPRIPGTAGSDAFNTWIHSKVAEPWFIYTQNFTYKEVELRNYVISTTDELPPYLIAAHYDSRAVANNDPNFLKREEPVPGANDGASGVAAILELINKIPVEIQSKIGFLLFDGEDQGSSGIEGWDWIIGSTYFANEMSITEVANTVSFILLDMVGDDELNLKIEQNGDEALTEEVWKLAADLGYADIFLDEQGYNLIDDHIPFKRRGIDTLDIIDFDYPEWHTTNDDIDNISATSIAIVTDVVLSYLTTNNNITIPDNTSNSVNSDIDFQIFSLLLIIIPVYRKYKSNK